MNRFFGGVLIVIAIVQTSCSQLRYMSHLPLFEDGHNFSERSFLYKKLLDQERQLVICDNNFGGPVLYHPSYLTDIISVYRSSISPRLEPIECMYYPSCSQYFIEVCNTVGISGVFLFVDRFIRSNRGASTRRPVFAKQGRLLNLDVQEMNR